MVPASNVCSRLAALSQRPAANLQGHPSARLGPHAPLPPEPLRWPKSALFEARESARKVFRQAMPKTMYWLGTGVLLNHVLEHCWPHALRGPMPPHVCQIELSARRLRLYTGATHMSAQEFAWQPAVKLQGSGANSCITMDHVLQTEPAAERAVVLHHVEHIWLAFKDLGIGSLHGGVAARTSTSSLSPRCQKRQDSGNEKPHAFACPSARSKTQLLLEKDLPETPNEETGEVWTCSARQQPSFPRAESCANTREAARGVA